MITGTLRSQANQRRFIFAVVVLLAACTSEQAAIEGLPSGPLRLTLAMDPPAPMAGETPTLAFHLSHTATKKPVVDLQVIHERVMHNFIVARDFSSFAHIHHEDFNALDKRDLDSATFRFPYTFPRPGRYRIVTEFTHRDRTWAKHFDVDVRGSVTGPAPIPKPRYVDRQEAYQADLHVASIPLIAAQEVDLTVRLTRDRLPIRDLKLYLGSEAHVALWRTDGAHFGHTHAYTSAMAKLSRHLREAPDAESMSRMMAAMMSTPAQLEFPGPEIPLKYRFPAPGLYVVFVQLAPGGKPRVFDFVVEVGAASAHERDH